ncbi:flagellar hook-associated protein FlgK [Bacillus sp. WLY-B-L8]|uniref:flagellar hook-associated protein FlgK n=1 Tax=Bacillus multifaciens TaxID=3068506 RepID=UPI00274126CB|nr:flagellar hook-associated protein FlgK [Bacillus sp. WLY-B-L8]MDP7980715.1 flagellar hook-associated protein FlgK [Bacillus sp. WLY-B-L8]
MKLTDYNTSLSGMLAAQLGLQTTRQNLTNMRTPGYVRQVVNYSAVGGSRGDTPEQRIGYGVKTVSIDRVTDEVKTRQYNEQLSQFSYHSYMNSILSRVETVVGSPNKNSLSSLMDQFYNSFREVAKNPEQPNYYNMLVANTNKFTNQLNRIAKNFEEVEAQAGEEAAQHVKAFNRLADSLAETNWKIGQAGEHVPNQLLDERDKIISEMSQYANIDVLNESINPNIVSVRINGVLLVSGQDIIGDPRTQKNIGNAQNNGQTVYPLDLIKNNNNTMSVKVLGTDVQLQGGTIQAALDAKKTIAGYKEDLNNLMMALKGEINGVMQKDFFVGTDAKGMRINPDFEADVTKMKISVDTANALAAVGDRQYAVGLTYKQTLDKQIVQVAADTNAFEAYKTIHGDLLNGIQQEKSSLEGVNMDEEMVNLMAYQKYFVANSKAITTLNEVFDSLFSIIR